MGRRESGDHEFGFGHVEVPNRLPNGSIERIGEYMSLNSGVRSNVERYINLGAHHRRSG